MNNPLALCELALHRLKPPFGITGMTEAVARISDALLKGERMLIFGDYDVDGVTATILLYQFLKEINAEVSFHIPQRVTDRLCLGLIRQCRISSKQPCAHSCRPSGQ